MTSEDFMSVLAKGLGRTTFALRNDPEKYADIIVSACLENLQHDRTFEENRAEWMMRLVDLAGVQHRVLEAILGALPSTEEGWDRDWMIDLLGEFATGGDHQAGETLRGLAEKGEKRAQDTLADSGEEGLAWVAEHVVPNLAEDDLWRISMWLPHDEKDDETPIQRRLRAIDRENDARRKAKRQAAEKPLPTARSFLKNRGDSDLRPYYFAKVATRREWREAAELFLSAPPNRRLLRLNMAYRIRPFPLPLRRLFAQTTHRERGWAVCLVLGHIDAPQVRHFARRMIRTRPLPSNAIRTLSKSFRPGDEDLVGSVFPDAATYNDDDRHQIVLDMIDLMFKHPKAHWQPHAEWAYEHSPCSMCRLSAFNWMRKHGNLPPAILEEAPYDAESEIRKVAEGGTRSV